MDDLEALTAQLRINPLALSLRAMWQDCYQETKNCDGSMAKIACDKVWTEALDGWYLESAAVLIHDEGPKHTRARFLVRTEAHVPADWSIAVYAGFLPPHLPNRRYKSLWRGAVVGIMRYLDKPDIGLHRLKNVPARPTCLVGSRWVLEHAKNEGLKWVYPSLAELHQEREEYKRTHSAAGGTTDGEKGTRKRKKKKRQ